MSDSAGPEYLEDSVRGNIAEIDQRHPMAARDSVVLHRNDVSIQFGKSEEIRKIVSLVSTCANHNTADGLRMEPCLRRTGRSFRLPTGHLSPQRPLGRLQERRKW
jgi:hypothetical protein